MVLAQLREGSNLHAKMIILVCCRFREAYLQRSSAWQDTCAAWTVSLTRVLRQALLDHVSISRQSVALHSSPLGKLHTWFS